MKKPAALLWSVLAVGNCFFNHYTACPKTFSWKSLILQMKLLVTGFCKKATTDGNIRRVPA
jgi:hypothetical protein